MNRVVQWLLVGLAITVVSVAVFILAAMLFPGDPGKFYLILSLVTLTLAVAVRVLGFPRD